MIPLRIPRPLPRSFIDWLGELDGLLPEGQSLSLLTVITNDLMILDRFRLLSRKYITGKRELPMPKGNDFDRYRAENGARQPGYLDR